MLFLDPGDGRVLGFIELENRQHDESLFASAQTNRHQAPGNHNPEDLNSVLTPAKLVETANATAATAAASPSITISSALRGMLVAEECRGKGYARVFLGIWLRICSQAGVTPATSRINKPLLALTLVRLGFTPLRGGIRRGKPGKKRKPKQRPLAVEVSVGEEDRVLLYCPVAAEAERLRAGFSATEVRSQRLVVATAPPEPRGRVAHIRVRYAPPSRRPRPSTCATHDPQTSTSERAASQLVHAPLEEAVGAGRLRLCATQGPETATELEGTTDGTLRVPLHLHPSSSTKKEMLRVLTGRL